MDINIFMIHFYCFHSEKKIIASDLPIGKIKSKYGYKYEVLTSIKEREAFDTISTRLLRSYPGFTIEQVLQKEKIPISKESRKKISDSKIGRPRDEATRQKISAALKGRSNFKGKRHSEETKSVMSDKKIGNSHTKEYYWVHDPGSEKEKRVRTRADVPRGYSLGRDYYSTEAGLYFFNINRRRG